jgi:hypothetical protein
MIRLFALPALGLVALAFGASEAFAETDAERSTRCEGQTMIVTRAVDLRASGTDQPGTIARLEASDSGIDPKYAPSISVLVGWIYTLPTDQLTAETASAFQTQCLGYRP